MAAIEEKKLAIPNLVMGHLTITIAGKTPLIVHRFSEEEQKKIERAQGGEAKVKKPPRNPTKEFEDACYHTETGEYAFPSIGIKRAMVTAGQRFADERSTELLGIFTIPQELVEIISSNPPKMRADRVVLSGIGRVSSIAYRPAFYPWSMTFPLDFNKSFITIEQVANLLKIAGFAVGLGDWRVEKKGTFGQFDVAEMLSS